MENLNSILDDNKKLNLPNGESIFLSHGMSLLMETDHLLNATPATISRCGLLHLESKALVKPKYLFNTWLKNLPTHLSQEGGANDIENYCNCLISIAMQVHREAATK